MFKILSIRLTLLLFFTLFFFSCDKEQKTYRLIYSADEPLGEIAKTIKHIVEKDSESIKIELVIGEGSYANMDSLAKGKADFSIIENHMPFSEELSSLLPLYPQILHIFYHSENEITDFKELIYGKKVFAGIEGSGTHRFMMDLFDFYEVDKSRFTITEDAFDNDIYCGFADIIKPEYLAGFEGFRLYSFDKAGKFGQGSIAEGISLRCPQVKPIVIPEKTYGKMTIEPVLTLATDAVLVANSELPDEVTYEITKKIFHFSQEFTEISPLLFLDMKESFDREKLNYPLANGSRIYLDRDEPSFLERYAELMGLLFSIGLALISATISISRWRKQTKKDRVDIFYAELMDVKKKLMSIDTIQEARELLNQIKKTQDKAFEMLIDEKLIADESFRIYMELSKETIQEVKFRAQQLSKKT